MVWPGNLPLQRRPGERARRLLDIYHRLGPERRRQLLEFAEFLQSREERGEEEHSPPSAESSPLPPPRPEEAPADESVVAAMRRLSRVYPLADKSVVLNEASALMAQHVMQGRDRTEVIVELEQLFRSAYLSQGGRLGEGEEA